MSEPNYVIKDSQSESLRRKEYNAKGNRKKRTKRKEILSLFYPKSIITKEIMSRMYRND